MRPRNSTYAVGRRPRRERDEGRRQRQSRRAAGVDGPLGVCRACAPSSAVASTSSSNDSKALVTRTQPVSPSAAAAASTWRTQVLDLDGDVVGEAGESRVPSASTTAIACRGPLRKSGSPKVMCVAPASTCCAMSASTTSDGHDAKLPVVDRHDRAVAAPVLAAARRLGVAGDAPRPVRQAQVRVAVQRRQRAPVRHAETRGAAGRLPRREAGRGWQCASASDRDEIGLALDARARRRRPPRAAPRRSAARRARRRTSVAAGVTSRTARDQRQREPRGGVHRQVKGHDARCPRRRPPCSGVRDVSTQTTSCPASRSHAAGDASPKGWRPRS